MRICILLAIFMLLLPVDSHAQLTASQNQPLSSGTSNTTAQQVTLRYKYTPGEVLKYRMSSSTIGTIKTGGHTIPMNQSMYGTVTQTVQSVDASGNATLLSQISSLVITSKVNGKAISPPRAAEQTLKSGYTMVMSPLGRLISFKSNAQSPTGSINPSQLTGPGGLSSWSFLPDHPVKVGDVWNGNVSAGPLGMALRTTMTLTSLDAASGQNLATIAFKTEADMSGAQPGLAHMKGYINGAGTDKLNVDSGTLTHVSMAMTLHMSSPPPARASHQSTSPASGFNMTMAFNMQMNLIPG